MSQRKATLQQLAVARIHDVRLKDGHRYCGVVDSTMLRVRMTMHPLSALQFFCSPVRVTRYALLYEYNTQWSARTAVLLTIM